MLVVIWFASAIAGVIAALGALAVRRQRASLLVVAGACFAVAGVLGILSIGILFLALSVACFAASGRPGAYRSADTVG